MITQTRLMELLNYNSATGTFTWKVSRRGVKAGAVAGRTNSKGYIVIGVDGKLYKAHRLAWLYTYGSWPIGQIDHKDLVKTNNAITNLRDVTNRENSQNRSCHANGRLVGADFHKASQKWRARIYINGKKKHLGYFTSEVLANEAYLQAFAKV